MKATGIPIVVLCAAFTVAATDACAQLQGTLFTQPDEREYLDYLREEFLRNSAEAGFDIAVIEIPDIPTAAEAEPSGPTEFSFGGIMTRRDASRSVWLNGRLLDESALPDGISLLNGARTASLRIAIDDNVYVLRPGQTLDLTTGSVVESYQRTPVEPTPATPAPATPVVPQANSNVQSSPSEAEASTPLAAVPEASVPEATAAAPVVSSTEIATAIQELDDADADALFEALQKRRLERQVDQEPDATPDD